VTVNSFYAGSQVQWFKAMDFMDGMWRHVRGGNADWTVLTPDGKYLDRSVAAGYAKWLQLPASERRPGSVAIKTLTARPKAAPPDHPPAGTLVLRVFQRNLKRIDGDQLVRLDSQNTQAWTADRDIRWRYCYNDSFADVMWVPEIEWRSLVPASPRKDQRFSLPRSLKRRMVLWHLTNRTFCVGEPWEERDILIDNLTVTVEDISPDIRLRLEGSLLLEMKGTPEDMKRRWQRSKHRYDPNVLGFITYSPSRKAFTRFDVVALGDYSGGDCEGGRHSGVGRLPLAIAFELPDVASLAERLLPCGGVYFAQYWNNR